MFTSQLAIELFDIAVLLGAALRDEQDLNPRLAFRQKNLCLSKLANDLLGRIVLPGHRHPYSLAQYPTLKSGPSLRR